MHEKTKKISLMHKFIIIALIISLSMSNFLTVATYAVSQVLDKQTEATINKNVKFDTYFKEDNGNTHYFICDVNETNSNLTMNLNVLAGYLKEATIEIKEANYNMLNIVDDSQKVQKAENNKIELRQINEGENVELGITIGNTTSEEMNLSDISKDSKIVLNAIYVDEKGNEITIEKEVILNISWTGTHETEISSEIVKYTNFIKENKEKVLIQVLTKTGLKESTNKLPIKESNINVTIPTLAGTKPEEVLVMAKSTVGTNGKGEGLAEIADENIVKDLENGTISVKIENKEENGKIWNGKGQDELLFTYIYDKAQIVEEQNTISSKINAEITTYSATDVSKSNAELVSNYDLTSAVQNLVSLDAETTTTEINKGKLYANIDSNEKQYDTTYNISTLVGIAYKDIVTELKIEETNTYFTDVTGHKYLLENAENVYAYYKSTTISKENFEKILGEEGEIKIIDANGNVISLINKESQVDANGNYVMDYANRYNRLTMLTTKPVSEGELLINHEKAISADLPYDKEQARMFANLVSQIQIAQNINGEYLALDSKEISIPFTETYTNANISLSKEVLSTIVNNEDVEIKVELDNTRENTDLYKNGTLKIEFPEYIEEVIPKTSNILYAEGLAIKEVLVQNENEKVVMYISLEGTQQKFSTGSVTNGTNVIVNADIKTKLLTPTTEDFVKMYYSHDNATSYANLDEETGLAYNETKIGFSAPTGMLAVSKISGYEETGKSVISVNQGTVVDKIKMDSDAKNASMELMLINNTGSTCNTVSVIGRIPFEGNKKVGTDEDLQTTVNTSMMQGIEVKGDEAQYATIYYSANGEATEDLNDANNMWTLSPADFSQVKSYMIVFENYEFKQGETINMSYNFIVPEMIDLNNSLYGTFGASYEKSSEIGLQEESVVADVVGLTTGTGPVMEINQKVSVGEDGVIQEGQIIKYTITIKNAGTSDIENLKVKDVLPDYTTYVEYQEPDGPLQGTDGQYVYPETQTDAETGKSYIEWDIGTVKPDETITKEISVKVNNLPTIFEYYQDNENLRYDEETKTFYLEGTNDETGEVTRQDITSIPETKIYNTLMISATDLELKVAKSGENKVEKLQFIVEEKSDKAPSMMLRENEELTYTITVRNNTENAIQNVQLEKVIPGGVEFLEAIATTYNNDSEKNEQVAKGSYNSDTRIMAITIPSLDADEFTTIKIKVITAQLENGVYEKDITTSSAVYANKINKHITTEIKNTVAKPHLVIEQTDSVGGEYVSEGDRITFILTIKNEGKIATNTLNIVDEISDKFKFINASYEIDNRKPSTLSAHDNVLSFKPNLEPGSTVVLKVTVAAGELPNSVDEATAENIFTITGEYVGELKSNAIKKTVEQSTEPNKPENDNKPGDNKPGDDKPDDNKPGDNKPGTNKPDEVKTYKIKGTAWLDENQNGARENNEKLFSGIKLTLINAKTGDIITDRTTGKAKETVTANNGTYEFDNLVRGEYIVVFYHDSSIYGLTEYAKSGVNTELNSDAVTNTLKVDTNSISGIDIGLVIDKKMDLKLDKYVSTITVQNKQGVKTYNYSDATLAKVDIRSKYLAGSVVVIEYSIVVRNEGNLPAYAKQIVDYMPADLKFNSDLNANWYAGNDGNLYCTELANTVINPGESKTVKLILTKTMTENNTKLTNNRAEIYEQYNELGIGDIDSTQNNQAAGEDDMGAANVLISPATGTEVTYTCTILVALVILATGIYFIKRKTSRYYN